MSWWNDRVIGDADLPPHEHAMLRAVRRAVVPTLALPWVLAGLAAGLAGTGPSPAICVPLALVAVVAALLCWRRVKSLRRRPDDGDDWRRGGEDHPLAPAGGPGGIAFEWDAFERDFRAYVAELERAASSVLVLARGRLAC